MVQAWTMAEWPTVTHSPMRQGKSSARCTAVGAIGAGRNLPGAFVGRRQGLDLWQALPLLPAATLGKLGAGGTSSNKFDGKGTTSANNNFTGSITATVIEVLPNGHLIVSGEKQIGLSKSVDVLRFSGQVDPYTIQPGNTVLSTQVANVRIEQRGRGATADAHAVGWLSRFFLNIAPS